FEFIHRDNQLEQANLTREAFQNPGTIVRSEARVRGRDGSWIPVEFSGCVSEGPDGNPILVATMRNIAERKRAQEELRRREEYFRSLIEASSDFIIAIDRGGSLVFAGGQGLRDFVDEPSNVVGRAVADFEHPDDIAEQMRLLGWCFENPGNVIRSEARVRARGGNWIPFEFMGRVSDGPDGNPILVSTGRNITERKRIEYELAAARDAALAASRAKSEFVSSMSHEIRTPMNAILGMADLLWETGLSAEQRRYLATVVSNGGALLELINSVLDFAKVESGRMSLERAGFDLIDLVERVAEMFAARAHEKHLELAVRIAPGLAAAVEGDALRLRQILINLVGNAVKFTERGEIVISVAPAAEPKTGDGQMIEFTVTDTGIGLSAAELAAIFEPFTQADSSTTRRYGGSGLGLAIVERLAALMGGRVWVESSTDAGSRFHFTARLGTPSSAAAVATRSEPDLIADLRGQTILIVEEHAVSREILANILNAAGATVIQAASAVAGIALLEPAGAGVSAPTVILAAAAADGCIAMLERMRKAHPDIGVVMMLTADTMAQSAAAIHERGIYNYVVKPVKRRELFSAIAGALAPRDALGCAPAAVAMPAPGGGARQPAPRILDRPLRILLADDSPDNRMLIQAYLKKTPYQLATAENGRIAFDKFVAAPADVILMDIQMPVLDGYGAARLIRSHEADASIARTPIIALSASALDESVSRAREAGCDMHVSKPVKRATLLNAIADAVEPLSALT
ncbi:MAG TPA: response regulator, partial [Candidatus Binataceae bacterium]|nr:response regulator [Candidatus Binataceae bacterium]